MPEDLPVQRDSRAVAPPPDHLEARQAAEPTSADVEPTLDVDESIKDANNVTDTPVERDQGDDRRHKRHKDKHKKGHRHKSHKSSRDKRSSRERSDKDSRHKTAKSRSDRSRPSASSDGASPALERPLESGEIEEPNAGTVTVTSVDGTRDEVPSKASPAHAEAHDASNLPPPPPKAPAGERAPSGPAADPSRGDPQDTPTASAGAGRARAEEAKRPREVRDGRDRPRSRDRRRGDTPPRDVPRVGERDGDQRRHADRRDREPIRGRGRSGDQSRDGGRGGERGRGGSRERGGDQDSGALQRSRDRERSRGDHRDVDVRERGDRRPREAERRGRDGGVARTADVAGRGYAREDDRGARGARDVHARGVGDRSGGERRRGNDRDDARGRGGDRRRGASERGRGGRSPERRKRRRDESPEVAPDEILAEFEDMMTEEEREAREVEERRRKRLALQAKLAEQASANKAAAADASADAPADVPPSQASAQQPADAAAPPAEARAGAAADDGGENGNRAGGVDGVERRVDDDEGTGMDVDSDAEAVDAAALFRQPSADPGPVQAVQAGAEAAKAGDASGESEVDIFADDDEDEGPVPHHIDAVGEHVDDDRVNVKQAENSRKHTAGLSDMYDDSQGYYNFRVGEIMDGRYEVVKGSGKGVFSSVVTACDRLRQDATGANPQVAIKLIRANDVMFKAGKLEQQVLDKLAASDPDNRKHIIRLLRSFEYRNHLCLVFEHMEMNLRELVRKVGVGRGIKVDAVGQLTLQMLIALKHLRDNNILHADIKPDNILINSRMNKIKLCDLGSAMFCGGNDPTPYLVSRFYRAPEVILGLQYDFAVDVWSIACTVFELFTADILFKGRTNNEMLKLMMDLKGPFPKKMLKKGCFTNQHFADDLSFMSTETDVVTKEPVKKLVANPKRKHTFLQVLTRAAGKECRGQKIPKEELRKVEMLAEFLERCTTLDPSARLTPAEAMQTKFILAAKAQISAAAKAHKHAK